MDRDEMTQQISPTETVNLIDLLADFAERSRGIVMLIMKSLNYYSLKLISSHAQSQYKKGLLRLWTCLMAYDPQMQEDHLQNLTQFLFSFLRRDAEMHPSDEDILRVEFLLTLACFTKNSARIRLRDSEVHKLITKHLRSPLWKLQCWTCLLLSQLCFECNELKEFLLNDLRKSLVNPAQSSDLLDLLAHPQPEVRAAALLLLESFVGFGSSGYQGTRNSIHVYLNHDELNKLVDTEDQSAKFDQLLLNRISERISMNREGSVLVRRELMRLILKIFCRRCHMAHMICFVDRILKGEMEVARLLNLLDEDKHPTASPPSDFNPFYVKHWILFLYLRDAEPNLTIRNAVSHYVYVICKNVDYLKSSGTLPSTRSIFDLASALKFSSQAKPVSTASLPTLPIHEPTRAPLTDLPLISTSSRGSSFASRHASFHRNSQTAHPPLTSIFPNNPAVPTVPTVPTVSTIPTVTTGSTVSTVSTIPKVPTVSTIPSVSTIPTIPTGSTVSTVSTLPPIPTGAAVSTVSTVSRLSPIPSGSTVSPVSPPLPAVTTGSSRGGGRSLIPAGIAQSSSFVNLHLMQQGASSPEPVSHIDSMLETQLGLLGLPHTFLEWSLNNFMEWKDDSAGDERREKRRRLKTLLGGDGPLDCADCADYARVARSLPRGSARRRWKERRVLRTEGEVTCLRFHPLFTAVSVGVDWAFHVDGGGEDGFAVRLPRESGDAAAGPEAEHVRDVAGVDQSIRVRIAGGRDAKRGHLYLGHPTTAGRVVFRGLPRVLEGPAEGQRGHARHALSLEPVRRFARNRGDHAAREGLEPGDRAARVLPRHRRGIARGVAAVGGAERLHVRAAERPRAANRRADARRASTLSIAAKRREARRTGVG